MSISESKTNRPLTEQERNDIVNRLIAGGKLNRMRNKMKII